MAGIPIDDILKMMSAEELQGKTYKTVQIQHRGQLYDIDIPEHEMITLMQANARYLEYDRFVKEKIASVTGDVTMNENEDVVMDDVMETCDDVGAPLGTSGDDSPQIFEEFYEGFNHVTDKDGNVLFQENVILLAEYKFSEGSFGWNWNPFLPRPSLHQEEIDKIREKINEEYKCPYDDFWTRDNLIIWCFVAVCTLHLGLDSIRCFGDPSGDGVMHLVGLRIVT